MIMIILQPIENACPFLPPIKARKVKPHRKGGKSTKKEEPDVRWRKTEKKGVKERGREEVVDEVVMPLMGMLWVFCVAGVVRRIHYRGHWM
jgi:hypothetical protein